MFFYKTNKGRSDKVNKSEINRREKGRKRNKKKKIRGERQAIILQRKFSLRFDNCEFILFSNVLQNEIVLKWYCKQSLESSISNYSSVKETDKCQYNLKPYLQRET